jgi:hypothetical protein
VGFIYEKKNTSLHFPQFSRKIWALHLAYLTTTATAGCLVLGSLKNTGANKIPNPQ